MIKINALLLWISHWLILKTRLSLSIFIPLQYFGLWYGCVFGCKIKVWHALNPYPRILWKKSKRVTSYVFGFFYRNCARWGPKNSRIGVRVRHRIRLDIQINPDLDWKIESIFLHFLKNSSVLAIERNSNKDSISMKSPFTSDSCHPSSSPSPSDDAWRSEAISGSINRIKVLQKTIYR